MTDTGRAVPLLVACESRALSVQPSMYSTSLNTLHLVLVSGRLDAVFPELRAVAILRNPWARTLSAFHDYVRMGGI